MMDWQIWVISAIIELNTVKMSLQKAIIILMELKIFGACVRCGLPDSEADINTSSITP